MTWRATWAAPFDETKAFASEREAEEWAEEWFRETGEPVAIWEDEG